MPLVTWHAWNNCFTLTGGTSAYSDTAIYNGNGNSTSQSATIYATSQTYTSSQTLEVLRVTWQCWNLQNEISVETYYNAPRPLTPEEQQHAETMARQYLEAKELAQTKAETLLREHLTAQQLAELIQAEEFTVLSETGKRYRVRRGFAGNVFLLDSQGRKVEKYCIHPEVTIPSPDVMLAQKLMLETCEAEFLRIANRTQLSV